MTAARQLLDRAEQERDPRVRLDILTDAVSAAIAEDTPEDELEARIELVRHATYEVGDTELALSSFAAGLALYDSDRARFADYRSAVMWQYKWMPSRLSRSPQFPLDQIQDLLEDLEQHYREEGIPPAGVYTVRFEEASQNGRLADASGWLEKLRAVPRDDFSDCEACEHSAMASFAVSRGAHEEAVELRDEMLRRELTCTDEPYGALAATLVSLRAAGRHQDAERSFKRVLRWARGNPTQLWAIPALIRHCVATGDLRRGFDLVERHLPWLDADRFDVRTHFDVLAAAGALLTRVVASGRGELPIRVPAGQYFPARPEGWTVSELASETERIAGELADAFDSRNGNVQFREQLAADFAVRAEGPEPDWEPAAPVTPVTGAEPGSATAWLQRADTLEGLDCYPEAAEAARRGLDLDPDPLTRAGLLRLVLRQAAESGDTATAESLAAERAAALRDAGLPDEATVEELLIPSLRFPAGSDEGRAEVERAVERAPTATSRARAVGMLAGYLLADEPESAIGLLREAVAATADDPRPFIRQRHASERSYLANSLAYADRPEEAAEVLRALLAEQVEPGPRARNLVMLASLLASAGDFDAGLPFLDEAIGIAETTDTPRALIGPLLFSAQLLLDAGDPARALSSTSRARRAAQLVEGHPLPVELHARALRSVGRAEDAVDVILTDLDRGADEQALGAVAALHHALGEAYQELGEWEQARDAFAEAARLYLDAAEPAGRVVSLLYAAELDAEYGDTDLAIAALRDVLDLAAETRDDGVALRARRSLAFCLMLMGDEEAIGTVDEALASVDDTVPGIQADLLLVKARILLDFERYKEAITSASSARDLFAELGDDAEAANAEMALSGAYAELGRQKDVVDALRSALARTQNEPGFITEASLRLAEALEALGRHEEARQVRLAAETAVS